MNLDGWTNLPNWIYCDPFLTDAQIRLLGVIFSYCNGRRNGYYIEQAKLAVDMHRGVSQLRSLLNGERRKSLVGLCEPDPRSGRGALIRTVERFDNRGRRAENQYHLVLESIWGVDRPQISQPVDDATKATKTAKQSAIPLDFTTAAKAAMDIGDGEANSPPPEKRRWTGDTTAAKAAMPRRQSGEHKEDHFRKINLTPPNPRAAGEPQAVEAANRKERDLLERLQAYRGNPCSLCHAPVDRPAILHLPDGRRVGNIVEFGEWRTADAMGKRLAKPWFECRSTAHHRCYDAQLERVAAGEAIS